MTHSPGMKERATARETGGSMHIVAISPGKQAGNDASSTTMSLPCSSVSRVVWPLDVTDLIAEEL